jgi:hypothetical protein
LKRLLLPIILFLSFGCSEESVYLTSSPCNDSPAEISWESTETYTLNIPDSASTFMYHRQLITSDSAPVYAYTDLSGKCIYFFNLDSGNFLRKVCIDDFRYKKIKNFFVHNEDSIFVAVADFEILLLNKNGERINKWDINNYLELDESRQGYHINSFSQHLFFNDEYGELHFTMRSIQLWDGKDVNKQALKLRMAINLSKNSAKLYGGYEEIYLDQTKGASYPVSHEVAEVLNVGNTAYFSFPISHNIYSWETPKNVRAGKFCAASSFIRTLPNLLPPDAESQESINFQIAQPYYGELFYHSELDVFSRIVLHEIPLHKPDGKLNNPNNRGKSIILFDRNMTLLGEVEIEDDELQLWGGIAHATPDGLIITKISTSENQKQFVKIKFQL